MFLKKHFTSVIAHQHKANNTAENPISKTTSTDLHTSIADIFPAIFEATLKSIAKDPMHKLFGESEVTLLSRVVLCLSGVHQFFLDTFMTVFSVGRTLCSTLDREYMFQKYHQTTVSADFTCGYMLLFGTLTFTSQGICNFVNILLMELMGNLIKERAESALKKAASEHETISDSDQNILFYVCGFIARSLKKRYSRSKSACPKKKKCLEKLVLKSPNSTFISRFSNWMSKNDRGGLLYPCDDSFLLVREFEMSIRKHVNLQNLSAKTLLCDNLKEHVLESFMVKHYCDKLFGDIDGDMDIVQSIILEDILCLFLTVRGYAITIFLTAL